MMDPTALSTNRPQVSDPKRKAGRSGPAPLVDTLERLREHVRRQLDRLESVALDRAAALDAALQRVRALSDRIAELESSTPRGHDEQREREWQEALEKLESDRRLLSEAWERLEREQVATAGFVNHNHAHTPRPSSAERQVERPSHSAAARPNPVFDTNDPVTQAVLRQFQALRSDVRRNAQERCLD